MICKHCRKSKEDHYGGDKLFCKGLFQSGGATPSLTFEPILEEINKNDMWKM